MWKNVGGTFVLTSAVLPNHGRSSGLIDLDHDGDADLLTVTADPVPFLQAWRNTNGVFTAQSATAIDNATELGDPELGDFDGDGDLDVVLGGSLFFIDDGTQNYSPLQREPAPWQGAESTVVAGDLDGDGSAELIAGGSVLHGNGDGYFTASQSLPFGTVGSLLVDVDGDGDLDLVATADPVVGGADVVMLNQNGTLVAQPPLPPGQLAGTILVADFDNDGRPDLTSWTGAVLRNMGGGSFAPAAVLFPDRPMAVGDFDGDGLTDLLVSGQNGFAVAKNVGGFVFQQGPSLGLGFVALAAGDVDGDGDIDLVGAPRLIGYWGPGGPPSILNVWRNDGVGGFGYASSILDGSWTPPLVALVDVDEDGALDVVSRRVWINDGTGGFFDRASGASGETALAVADIDADGDRDIVYTGPERPIVFVNRHRHLGASTVAVLGQPFAIDMAVRPGYSTGGDFVANAVGFSHIGPVRLPGLGLLQIDPTASIFAAPALTGVDGTHTFAMTLVSQPALAGVTVFWQGLVIDGAGARLTNFSAQRLVP